MRLRTSVDEITPRTFSVAFINFIFSGIGYGRSFSGRERIYSNPLRSNITKLISDKSSFPESQLGKPGIRSEPMIK